MPPATQLGSLPDSLSGSVPSPSPCLASLCLSQFLLPPLPVSGLPGAQVLPDLLLGSLLTMDGICFFFCACLPLLPHTHLFKNFLFLVLHVMWLGHTFHGMAGIFLSFWRWAAAACTRTPCMRLPPPCLPTPWLPHKRTGYIQWWAEWDGNQSQPVQSASGSVNRSNPSHPLPFPNLPTTTTTP